MLHAITALGALGLSQRAAPAEAAPAAPASPAAPCEYGDEDLIRPTSSPSSCFPSTGTDPAARSLPRPALPRSRDATVLTRRTVGREAAVLVAILAASCAGWAGWRVARVA